MCFGRNHKAPLTAGVLIIGSLYWKNGGRELWRNTRLDRTLEWDIRVPIRYGRKSSNQTYTMVFAPLGSEQFGIGKVIACRAPITSCDDLIYEAEWLWAAEDNKVKSATNYKPSRTIASGWGCVALLPNPASDISAELLDCWANRISREPNYGASEARLVDAQGLLKIEWPKQPNNNDPLPLDLLLATSNDPANSYPNADSVACAWLNQQAVVKAEYFHNNRSSGITTFQDEEIQDFLEPTKKSKE
jgi:hypothetical protein